MINDLSVGSESHKEFDNAMQKRPEGMPIKGTGNFTVQVRESASSLGIAASDIHTLAPPSAGAPLIHLVTSLYEPRY